MNNPYPIDGIPFTGQQSFPYRAWERLAVLYRHRHLPHASVQEIIDDLTLVHDEIVEARLRAGVDQAVNDSVAAEPVQFIPTVEQIDDFLFAKHVTLWQEFIIQDEKGRRKAAEWLHKEITNLHEFVNTREEPVRYEPNLTRPTRSDQ